jgi:diguanylate cyclase (GGDEF)-like protein/PAS domain S-box-containing protein
VESSNSESVLDPEVRHPPEYALAVLGREQARAIETLQAEARSYGVALGAAPHGICIFDAAGRVLFSNERFARTYRLPSSHALIGMTLSEAVDLQSRAGTVAAAPESWPGQVRRALARQAPGTSEVALADGRLVQVSDYPTPDGGWVSIHNDLSEYAEGGALAAKRMTLQALIDLVPDNLWVKDLESRFIIANDATATQIGLSSSRDLIGKSDFELHPHANAEAYRAEEQKILRAGRARVDFEEFVASPSGGGIWVSSTKAPVRNDKGEITGLLGISRDITARKLAEKFREDQAEILEAIAMGAPLREALDKLARLCEGQMLGMKTAILLIDETGRRLRVGAAPALPPDFFVALDGQGMGPNALSSGVAAHRREAVFVAEIATSPYWTNARQLAEAHGLASCWSAPILSPRGEALGVVDVYLGEAREPSEIELRVIETTRRLAGIAIERKLAEDRIQFMATHDALTGLPNRTLLKERVEQAIAMADRYGSWACVAFVDLDNFKFVNDSLGHASGDQLLKAVAKRMKERLKPADAVVRVGGDEFVIALGDVPKDIEALRATLETLQRALMEPIQLRGRSIMVTCSIGAACYPADAASADELLANADSAMYHAKDAGRENVKFYTPELNIKSSDKLQLRDELRAAILREEFCLHYQPQIDLCSGAVLAVEALIRWNHPTRGLLAPTGFVSVAEEAGMIVAIGEWVIRESCRQNKAWQDAGLPPIRMCVNVSARQFRDRKLLETVELALRESGLSPEHLELELTESMVMQDVTHAVGIMVELRRLGVQLSIDDFGTGYSSLSALKIFPVARLKIDKSFVNGLPHNTNDSGVTAAVIALARNLNLKVIAEGVETAQQAAFLHSQNCDEVQGFHYSRPVPAGEFASFMVEFNESQPLLEIESSRSDRGLHLFAKGDPS